MANQPEPLDRVFHALSDPTRRAIVMQLSQRPTAVSALFAPLPMAMPTLLKHIRVLEDSGLVATKKTGRVRTCEMRPAALIPTEVWLAKQRALWSSRLDRMEAYAATLQAPPLPSQESEHAEPDRPD
jgi:DNA-binding transcriptional ArsR family regulator